MAWCDLGPSKNNMETGSHYPFYFDYFQTLRCGSTPFQQMRFFFKKNTKYCRQWTCNLRQLQIEPYATEWKREIDSFVNWRTRITISSILNTSEQQWLGGTYYCFLPQLHWRVLPKKKCMEKRGGQKGELHKRVLEKSKPLMILYQRTKIHLEYVQLCIITAHFIAGELKGRLFLNPFPSLFCWIISPNRGTKNAKQKWKWVMNYVKC